MEALGQADCCGVAATSLVQTGPQSPALHSVQTGEEHFPEIITSIKDALTVVCINTKDFCKAKIILSSFTS